MVSFLPNISGLTFFCYSDLHPTSLTVQHSQLMLGYYLPSLTLFSQFHPLPIILLSNPVKKKNQSATSSAIQVAYPAMLPFYGREMRVEISSLCILHTGRAGFLTQVLCHFR